MIKAIGYILAGFAMILFGTSSIWTVKDDILDENPPKEAEKVVVETKKDISEEDEEPEAINIVAIDGHLIENTDILDVTERDKKPKISDGTTIEEKLAIACDIYDVPYDIVLAIARLETGWFSSDAYIYGNNPGGMSVNEVPITYSSLDEGVEAMVSNLAKNYFGIGLTTPEEIGSKYCPINPDWPVVVRELMAME